MIMNFVVFKFRTLFIVVLLLFSFSCLGEDGEGYKKRVDRYQTKWQKLIPVYAKTQFAGGMGLLSFGVGWDYGRKDQWETDLFLGFIPRYDYRKARPTLTVKQNYIPWNIPLGNKGFTMDPLTCTFYMTTILNNDYWAAEPDKYPNSYYSFSTKIRFNIAIGQRFTYNIIEKDRKKIKSFTFFYEFGTNELYIISAFGNRYLKPKDYIKLSLGLKFQIL